MIEQTTSNQLITAYVGLGSNLADPVQQIYAAESALAAVDGIIVLNMSSLYKSPPMGPQDQPDYINAVIEISTTLSPLELLKQLQWIENIQGRVRQAQRWVARTLDLDLLIYGKQQITLPQLQVPHVGIAERAFVLYPLQEVAPNITIPGVGAIADLIQLCPINGLSRLPA